MATPRFAIGTAFFVNGVLFASWVSRIPGVKDTIGLSEAALGLVLFAMGIGTSSALPLTGVLIPRYGTGGVTVGSTLVSCGTLAVVGAMPAAVPLAGGLALFGAAMGAMDVAMNAQASRLENSLGRSIMASFHGLWSLGALAGTAVGGLCAARGITPGAHFLFVAPGLAVVALLLRPLLVAEDQRSPPAALTWPSRAVLGVGVVAACGAVIEGGVAEWSGVFLLDARGTGPGLAAAGYAAFSLAMATGRLAGDRLIDRVGAVAALRIGALVAGSALAAALLSWSAPVSIAAFGLVGLGMSIVFPIAFSAAGRVPGTDPSRAIAAVATMGYGAGMLGPPFIGFAASATSLSLALTGLVVLSAVIALGAPRLLAAATRRS
ncbi:MAG TPA: MFS transporter [Vicinamibacteria bacterium]|nr:MFS transporter [Vicinamibacteria bacterium]